MLYAGLDLSRQRLDVHVLDEDGRTVEVLAVHPDADALRTLANRVLRHGQGVSAAIESMTGSRFVHDTLERFGWDVMIADAVKAKGVAPLAAKTDKIDAHVLAELARRDQSARDLAARSNDPRRARAGPLPAPSGPPPERVEVPHSCHAHDLRSHRSGHRPVRDIRPRAPRGPSAARALGGDHGHEPGHGRRAGPAHR